MKCNFCKRDETEVRDAITPVINDLQRQKEEKIKNISENYAERFEKVKAIKARFLNMNIYRFQNERDRRMYLYSDPNLGLLLEYFDLCKPLISVENTLNDLVNMFLKESAEKRLEMQIDRIEEEYNRIIAEKINSNRIYYGRFSKKINFRFENKESSDCRDIAICPGCLKKFNISISDAIEAEDERKIIAENKRKIIDERKVFAENERKIINELPSNKHFTPVYKIENSWLPKKSNH